MIFQCLIILNHVVCFVEMEWHIILMVMMNINSNFLTIKKNLIQFLVLENLLFQQQSEREFNEFSNRCQREFNEFQERANREFDEFVEKSNRDFEESGRAMLEAFMR